MNILTSAALSFILRTAVLTSLLFLSVHAHAVTYASVRTQCAYFPGPFASVSAAAINPPFSAKSWIVDEFGNSVIEYPVSRGNSIYGGDLAQYPDLYVRADCDYFAFSGDYDFTLSQLESIADLLPQLEYPTYIDTDIQPFMLITPTTDVRYRIWRDGIGTSDQRMRYANDAVSYYFPDSVYKPISAHSMTNVTNSNSYRAYSHMFSSLADRHASLDISVISEIFAGLITDKLDEKGLESIAIALDPNAPGILRNTDFSSGLQDWFVIREPSTVIGSIATPYSTDASTRRLVISDFSSTRTDADPTPFLGAVQDVSIPPNVSVSDLYLRTDYTKLAGGSGAFGADFGGSGLAGIMVQFYTMDREILGTILLANFQDAGPLVNIPFLYGPRTLEDNDLLHVIRVNSIPVYGMVVSVKEVVENYLPILRTRQDEAAILSVGAFVSDVLVGAGSHITGTRRCNNCPAEARIDVIDIIDGNGVNIGYDSAICSATASEWIYKSYVGYYGRCPDRGGYRYWCRCLEHEGGGTDLSPIIAAFGTSQEYTNRFGGLTDNDLINQLYQYMFDRNAEPEGLEYYNQLMEKWRDLWRDLTSTYTNMERSMHAQTCNLIA